MRLNTLINRVEQLRSDMDAIVKAACQSERVRQWIIKANQQQLLAGKNTEDELMNGGMYSRSHIRARLRRGLPIDHVYLSFTGNLQQGMDVVYGATGFSLVSSDPKQAFVDVTMSTGHWPSGPKYGPVFGLTAAHKRELSQRVGRIVAGKVRSRLTQ